MRKTGKPMQLFNAPRCGAHARRTGQPCKSPAVRGKKRCRMHGGKSTGRPVIHGRYTTKAMQSRRETRELLRQIRQLIDSVD